MGAKNHVTARNVMQAEVVKLHCDTSITSAVETLEEYAISGAPVVDDADNLIGVISRSDIARTEHIADDGIDVQATRYYRLDPLDDEGDTVFSRDDYDPELLDRQTVGDWMTPRIISVAPDASLTDVCGIMVKEGIHRVFVVDDGRLIGVISSFDVVKHLAVVSRN